MRPNRPVAFKDARRDRQQFFYSENESSRWLKILRAMLKQSGSGGSKHPRPFRNR